MHGVAGERTIYFKTSFAVISKLCYMSLSKSSLLLSLFYQLKIFSNKFTIH